AYFSLRPARNPDHVPPDAFALLAILPNALDLEFRRQALRAYLTVCTDEIPDLMVDRRFLLQVQTGPVGGRIDVPVVFVGIAFP
ncbi:hypothetical protein C1T15_28340, partial [Escherichia coli]